MKMEYLYTAWFRDVSLKPDDQDYEWPACIVIEAATLENATEWGDHLAKRYAKGTSNEYFLKSISEPVHSLKNLDLSETPHLKYGYEATDEEIGW